VHGRDQSGKHFSILDGPGYNTETTGLAFSPDRKFLFVSFQYPGVIWQFWREDGLPFTAKMAEIGFHENV
jgi:secreted PhoX family phosphatase